MGLCESIVEQGQKGMVIGLKLIRAEKVSCGESGVFCIL